VASNGSWRWGSRKARRLPYSGISV
jgi:hypothetical protein